MANRVKNYNFKKFQNTTRTFNSEEQFNLGMNYTDSPIDPGQVKVLFNYDIANDEVSLIPRPGFKTTEAAVSLGSSYADFYTNNKSAGEQILSSVSEILHEDVQYKCATMFDYKTQKFSIGTINRDKYNSEIGYKEAKSLLYIESNGNQWIDTEFKHNQNTRVVIDYAIDTYTKWGNIFGSFGGARGTNKLMFLGMFSYDSYYSIYGGNEKAGIGGVSTGRRKVDFNKNILTIDSTQYTFNESTFQSEYNMCIFAVTDYNGNASNCASMKLYSMQIYDNDILVRDFTPAIDTKGIVCLYDSVSKTYFYNQGTGNFTAGYEMLKPVYEMKNFADTSFLNCNQTSIRTLINEATPISNNFVRLTSSPTAGYPASAFKLADIPELQFSDNIVACVMYKYTSATTGQPRVGWQASVSGWGAWNVSSSSFWGGGMAKIDEWEIKRVKWDKANYDKVKQGIFGFCQLGGGAKIILDIAGISFYRVTDAQYKDTNFINSLGVAGYVTEVMPKLTDTSDVNIIEMSLDTSNIVVRTASQKNMAIHGISIPEYIYNRRQIGTKAWNNMYFFFGKEGSNAAALYNIKFDEASKKFVTNKVVPTQLTALEATPNKFNMLLDNPYNFTNSYVAGAFVLQGVLPYSGNNLIVSPKINTKYTYKICYTAPKNAKYDIVWEWKDFAGTEWTKLKTQTVTLSDATPPTLSCDFAAPIKESLIRVTVTGYTGDTKNTYPDQVSAISINCDSEVQKSAANSELKNYDLTTAKGMCYWQNRLVLWGFDDPIMFVSEANLPEWFPYPNNIDLFEEPIIHCEPYLDTLLVFTTQKLFQLSMLSDGSGWSKTCIQDHLQLTEFDTNFIKTIKNMVFFKSGNSYYMVVPSARTDAGLTIAPISKPIQWMLDNFKDAVTDIITDVYNYSEELTLVHCFNYINDTDIVINYVLKEESGFYLNFCLVYNTDDRTWRTQLFESQSIYTMCKLDATTDGTLATLTETQKYVGKELARALLIQFITRDSTDPKDFYIPKDIAISAESNLQDTFDAVHKYLNYQYLDTGYRSLGEVNTKKRHREIQLRINNKSKELLQFGTSFYIDGDDRKNMYKYEIEQDLDESSKSYGVINVVPVLQLDTQVASQTILGELKEDINAWSLGQSQFPEVPLNKIRIAVSGKGYHNKLKLLSINEKDYELLGLCWVFKYKNLR